MTNIRVERVLNVPKSYIWSIVGSYDKSPSKNYNLEITKIGDPENDGIGTERILHNGKRKIYERIVGAKKEEYFEYEILSGMPVKYYKGRAEFFDAGDGTRIVWTGEFMANNFVYDFIVRFLVRQAIVKTIDGLSQGYFDSSREEAN